MSNSTVIGTTSSFYGVATFQSQPIITSTAPSNTDNSTNIATTAWSNSFLTYSKTQPNTWSGDQTFGTANVGILNADTIKGASITSNMSIGANLNGGSISIGSTTGTTNISGSTINIGTHTTQTGNIAIGTNNAVLSGTNQIFIGASNKTTIINGVTNINTTGSATTTIGNANSTTTISSDNINIGTQNLATNAGISMATGTNGTGSYVNIGTTSGLPTLNLRAKAVNIASDGLPATGRVNIGTGTNNLADSQVQIGSETISTVLVKGVNIVMNDQSGTKVQIGAKELGVMYLRGQTVYINDGSAGYINNGNTVIGNTFGTGTITIANPLTTSYIPSRIDSYYQIGWTSFQSYYNVNVPYSGGDRIFAWWRVQPGVYIATYSSFNRIATSYKKSLFCSKDGAPVYGALATDIVSYFESGNDEIQIGQPGFSKSTGTTIISINSYMYIAFIQNIFYPGSPVGDIGYAINIVRIA